MNKIAQGLRKAQPFLWIGVAIALVNLVWVGLSRYTATQEMEQKAQARQSAGYRGIVEPTGTALHITQFYASEGVLTRGDHAVVCYGVQNAASVRIEPPVDTLKPARNRCFAVEPDRTTTYKLIAAGSDGTEISESFTIQVNPAPPKFLFVSISAKEINRGDRFAICYGVKHAIAVRLDPIRWPLRPLEKDCAMLYPARTTEFKIIATGEDGRTAIEKFTLDVK